MSFCYLVARRTSKKHVLQPESDASELQVFSSFLSGRYGHGNATETGSSKTFSANIRSSQRPLPCSPTLSSPADSDGAVVPGQRQPTVTGKPQGLKVRMSRRLRVTGSKSDSDQRAT